MTYVRPRASGREAAERLLKRLSLFQTEAWKEEAFVPLSFLPRTLCEDLTWKHHVKMVIEGPHIRMMEMRMEMTWMIYPPTQRSQSPDRSSECPGLPWQILDLSLKISSVLCFFFFFFELRFT